MTEITIDQRTLLRTTKNSDVELFTLKGLRLTGKVVEIYDGDTCKIVLFVGGQRQKFTTRLMGLDTPEMKPALSKPNRDQEIKAAHQCRNRVVQLVTNCPDVTLDLVLKKAECQRLLDLNTKLITVDCHEFDKYGRLLATLYETDGPEPNAPGAGAAPIGGSPKTGAKAPGADSTPGAFSPGPKSVNERLIDEGLAKAYDGGTKDVFTYEHA